MGRLTQSRRQLVGYQYPTQIKNDVSIAQPPGRDLLAIQNGIFTNQQFGGAYRAINKIAVTNADLHGMGLSLAGGALDDMGEMEGEGFGDILRKVVDKGKALASGASDFYSSNTGTFLKNLVPSSDPNARPSFPGEKHAILELANGKNGVANYMGPGTRVIERVRRGDPGRTAADKVAMRHDIDYVMAADSGSKSAQLDKVREADNRMISSLQKIQENKGDANRNIQMGLRLIQAKKLGEDTGMISKDAFAGDLTKLNDADKVLLMNERRKLGMEGYGLKDMRPGDALRIKVLKAELRKKKRQDFPVVYGAGSISTGSGLRLAGQRGPRGGSLVLPGSGSGQSRGKTLPGMKGYKLKAAMGGAGMDLGGIVESHVMPGLLKSVGINPSVIPKKLISSVINTVIANTEHLPLMKQISGLASAILPMLASAKIKQTGGSLSGAGLRAITHGPKKKQLRKSLEKGIYKVVKAAMKGKGLGLAGAGSFWEDFKKGFTMVFKPGAKILGGIANALGQPEFGVPLGIISDMM